MEFRILGSFEVEGTDGVLDVRGAKRRGLLACLVVHAGQPLSTGRLVDELWGDSGWPGAARTVQTYISQLRKLLRAERVILVTRPGGYALEVDPAEVDAHRFEQGLTAAGAERGPDRRLALLDEALALWQGRPLGEFAGAGWADREATRLEALHVQLLQRRYDALLALGRPGEAVTGLEPLVRAHPLDEQLWAQLMLALYRSGRQADALGAYQLARRHLIDELGIEPGPALTRLEHRILDHDPTLAAVDHVSSAVSGTATATFLFCDLVASTALTQRVGDDAGDELRRECYTVFREAIASNGGSEVKSTGDGIFAVFPTSVGQAVACGIAMQQGMARLDRAYPALGLALRVGIAVGEAKAEEGDWYGTPVVEADRLCAAAHPGQILVADVVRTLAGTRGRHSFRSVGALELKGLARPLPACQVQWSPLKAQDPGCQVVAENEEYADGDRGPTGAPTAVTPGQPPPQEIRFCTTNDGVRLAYAVMGAGPPLVKVANWLTHLDYDQETVVWRHWLTELSRRHRLIRYDERGCGLSDWSVPEFSFQAWVRDLEAVVDAVGLDRFPLLGISQGGPVAVAYAVRHPKRVSHLVLLGSFARGRRKRATTQAEHELNEARFEMVRLGWGRPDPLYRQIFVARFLPEGTQEEWRDFDELQRRSTSPENALQFVRSFADIDITDIAPLVSVPTLVAGARREPDNHFEQSRELASLIPGSALLPLDSCNHLLPERDPAWPRFLAALDAFLAADGTAVDHSSAANPVGYEARD